MKVFVWKRIKKASSYNYHSEGGIVAFADTEERAREIVNSDPEGCRIELDELPDEVRECSGDAERVLVMPDAGCC